MTAARYSVLIVHYDRLAVVTECVARLRCVLPGDVEIIVSDDGSPADVVDALRRLDGVRLVLDESNRGLGHNTNKGLRAVTTPYVLQIQDDHHLRPDAPPDFVDVGLEVFERYPEVDLVRYLVPYRLKVLEERPISRGVVQIFSNSIIRNGVQALNGYSDWPHLKRTSSLDRFGPFVEGRPVGVTELEYCCRAQRQGMTVAAVEGLRHIFDHVDHQLSYQVYVGSPHRVRSARLLRRHLSATKRVAAYGAYRTTGHFPFGWYE